jgi:hypothetical protein
MPHAKFVLHDVEEEEKAFHLCRNSLKLDIAFGLINTAPHSPLQIKNICGFVKIDTLLQSSSQK